MAEQASAPARPRGVPLGRPLGIPVYLAPSWVLIALFITVSTADGLAPAGGQAGATEWAIGFAVAVMLAASVLAHELGHSVISLLLGIPIRRITLFFFGGYAELARDSKDAAEEYLVAVAGPLVSLLLAGIGLAVGMHQTADTTLGRVMYDLGGTNLVLGVANLLPGLPLDGGRVLRSVIWARTGDRAKATRVAVIGGKTIAVLLGASGVAMVAAKLPGGLVNLLLAGFLWSSATAMGRQAAAVDRVPQLHVRKLAHPAIPVPAGLPLAEALRQGSVARSWLVAVDSYGRPSGVVSASAVDAVPAARRPWVTVGEVSRTVVPELVLQADLAGQAVIEALRVTQASEYLVVERDGAVVGVLAARDVAHVIDPRVATAEANG